MISISKPQPVDFGMSQFDGAVLGAEAILGGLWDDDGLHGDPIEQARDADAADHALLRLVLCAAGATLVLALASSLAA